MESVLAAWRDGGVPQEVAEMRLVRRLVAAGIPKPQLQHEIHVNGRFVARLDAAWPEVKVGFELDGFRWHGTPAGHQRDLVRHNRIKAAGWTVFQASPRDLRGDGRALADLAAPFFASLRAMRPA
jgi:very-short-patch-repair endonuclease